MAYAAPARMAALTDVTTQDWITSHIQPNDNQMDHLFHYVYPDLNQVLYVCRLTSSQKYAVLRQGVTSIADVHMLGATMETICDNFKHFNSLTEACGSTNFGVFLSYDRSVKKRIAGARSQRKINNRNYDVAICCMRSHECPGHSGSSHFRLAVWVG